MPTLVLPFPTIDPVLIEFGPFAIRWYALAYIAGLLIGWWSMRALVTSDKLWGAQIRPSLVDVDDFVVYATLGTILGGRLGYVLFYALDAHRRERSPRRDTSDCSAHGSHGSLVVNFSSPVDRYRARAAWPRVLST